MVDFAGHSGIKSPHPRARQKELAFYSKATADIEYQYPFTAPDFGELEGIAHRGSYDLSQHQQHSGQKLDYFDQDLQLKLKEQGVSPEEIKAKSRYVPNVIEPASGLTRAVLVVFARRIAMIRAGRAPKRCFRFSRSSRQLNAASSRW